MNMFLDRAHAFENSYAHEQNVLFNISCRRARLVGRWAAGHLGIMGDRAEGYAQEVVAATIEKPRNISVIRKLQADFERNGVAISAHRISQQLERQWGIARQQEVLSPRAG